MADRSEIVKNYIEAACRFAESMVAIEECRRGQSPPSMSMIDEDEESFTAFEKARDAYLALPEQPEVPLLRSRYIALPERG